MTVEALKSVAITNLDATPVVVSTSGEGSQAKLMVIDGYVSPTQLAQGDYYRVVRIPTTARIKNITMATDKALDSHSGSTVVFDVNVAFSDSTVDGTTSSNQGLIPTNAGTGATTTVGTYSNPNLLFGQVTPSSNSAAYGPTAIEFNGGVSHYNMVSNTNTPLWSVLGYTADPGGFMDILVYVSTAATTPVTTGKLYIRVSYAA